MADAGQTAEQHKRGTSRRTSRTADRGGESETGGGDRNKSPNIQWWSNAPWAPTGYGTQTAALCRRLRDRGHVVTISANFGVAGSTPMNWEGIPVFGSGFHGYSQDVIYGHFQRMDEHNPGPSILMTLYDVWVLDNPNLTEIPLVVSWTPIDTFPPNPKIVAWSKRDNVLPVAMSRFGQQSLQAKGVEGAMYVPHSIDTDVFTPDAVTPAGATGRKALGVDDDTFIVTVVSTNKGNQPADRKAYPEMIRGFAEFARDRDDVVLFIHADQQGAHNGVNLPNLCEDAGVDAEKVLFTDQYRYRAGGLPEEAMAAIYASSDVLLMASRGEGFGIPAVEAQACGTPVIVTDATAQTELCGDGWLVDWQEFYHPGQRAWWATPSVKGITGALEKAYERGPGATSDEARAFAERFDHDRVFTEHWEPVLQEVDRRLWKRVVDEKAS